MNAPTHRTRAQNEFLRKLHLDPIGIPADQWPSAALLRKWLRQPGFCAAINTLRLAMQTRTDLHLAAAAQNAAQTLHRSLLPTTTEGAELVPPTQNLAVLGEQRALVHALVQLLKLVKARGRDDIDVSPIDQNQLDYWRMDQMRRGQRIRERVENRALRESERAGDSRQTGSQA